jgi:two-component system response regulator FixJ
MHNHLTVFAIDSDAASRAAVRRLAESMNVNFEGYASGEEFLANYDSSKSGCVLMEVRIPDVSGLELQQQLAVEDAPPPVVFLTAHATVPVVVRAMRSGALDVMEKPFQEQELWETIQKAFRLDHEQRELVDQQRRFRAQLGLLTQKEHDVLRCLAEDKPTRAIARELHISVRTVELRKSQMSRKLRLKSPMALLRVAIQAYDGHPVFAVEAPADKDATASPARILR